MLSATQRPKALHNRRFILLALLVLGLTLPGSTSIFREALAHLFAAMLAEVANHPLQGAVLFVLCAAIGVTFLGGALINGQMIRFALVAFAGIVLPGYAFHIPRSIPATSTRGAFCAGAATPACTAGQLTCSNCASTERVMKRLRAPYTCASPRRDCCVT